MSEKTLRLHIQQWQGGNLEAYHLGAQLLAWLAPAANDPVATVDVAESDGPKLMLEDGIITRSVVLQQLDRTEQILRREAPDKVVVLGGDCLADLAPFAYLNERYEGDLAVLRVDAHPDVMTPQETVHAHAMVPGNLMGLSPLPMPGPKIQFATSANP
ncbi:arginase family protein [Labrys okinawensis]|uniref:arginase family protein n=1 Tax=Labrys okinawensis TaxID=346911 RepID=UPI0039BD27ED